MRKPNSQETQEAVEFASFLWCRALTPAERLTASNWIARHFKHGSSEEDFDFDRFPWLREPADSSTDYRIEESLLLCPPQVGKSLLAEATICFYIKEDPGDLTAYTHTIPEAKKWAEERVMPAIRRCQPLQALRPAERGKERTSEILFPHMVLEVAPANETSTQRRSRRLVVCDERWLWEPGRYDNAKRRTSSPNFDGRRKILSFSNSGKYESDTEGQWRASNQRYSHSYCPECGNAAPFKFSESKCRRVPATIKGFTLEWAENAVTRPSGVWDIEEVLKTVRLDCPHCHKKFEDTPRVRELLRRGFHYVTLNPKASAKSWGWAVSGVAVYPWADLVKQFLNAMMQLDLGDTSALEEFTLKGLNEPWSDDVIFDNTTNSTGDYEMNEEPWADSDFAAMTCDVQELAPYFWFVIRDWCNDGRSRLRSCGFAYTWEELRALQMKHQISDRFVHIDGNYDTANVHQKCAEYNWIVLRGRDEDSFLHTKDLQVPVRRYFSEPKLIDPAIGTDQQGNPYRRRAIEIQWANTPVKDNLARLFGGKGVYYGVPRNVPQNYLNHMQSERKKVAETRGTVEIRRWVKIGKRPNHLWDCEAMQIVFALMKGPLRRQQQPPPPPNDTPPPENSGS